jgi:hypothetical protein
MQSEDEIKRKDNVRLGMLTMLHMKVYLGQDKMEAYINTRFANKPAEFRKNMIGYVNKIYDAKHHPQSARLKG